MSQAVPNLDFTRSVYKHRRRLHVHLISFIKRSPLAKPNHLFLLESWGKWKQVSGAPCLKTHSSCVYSIWQVIDKAFATWSPAWISRKHHWICQLESHLHMESQSPVSPKSQQQLAKQRTQLLRRNLTRQLAACKGTISCLGNVPRRGVAVKESCFASGGVVQATIHWASWQLVWTGPQFRTARVYGSVFAFVKLYCQRN